MLRAADSPALSWRMTGTGSEPSTSRVAGSVEPSSTTTTRGAPPSWASSESTASRTNAP